MKTFMEAGLKESEHYLQQKTFCLSDIENPSDNSPLEGTPRVMTSIGDSESMSRLDGHEGESCPEEPIANRSTSRPLELDNGDFSPTQEMSSTFDEVSTDGSSSQDVDQLTPSDGVDDSTDDDDRGGDFTVSKYMQSKISRLEGARFGVWRVESLETQAATDDGVEVVSCDGGPSGTWEVTGPSHSAEGLPPLKLTLKKSLQGIGPDEQLPKERITKKKHKTKRSPSEPQDPQQRRRPGRPPTNNPPSLSTRQRLMNMFKKKYFKDRKRWARTRSTGSMPPTIRSIAKP